MKPSSRLIRELKRDVVIMGGVPLGVYRLHGDPIAFAFDDVLGQTVTVPLRDDVRVPVELIGRCGISGNPQVNICVNNGNRGSTRYYDKSLHRVIRIRG